MGTKGTKLDSSPEGMENEEEAEMANKIQFKLGPATAQASKVEQRVVVSGGAGAGTETVTIGKHAFYGAANSHRVRAMRALKRSLNKHAAVYRELAK